jgi:hypothetical protein
MRRLSKKIKERVITPAFYRDAEAIRALRTACQARSLANNPSPFTAAILRLVLESPVPTPAFDPAQSQMTQSGYALH